MLIEYRDILQLILLGYWLPFFTLAAVYFVLRRLEARRQNYRDLDDMAGRGREIEKQLVELRTVREELANATDFNKSYITSTLERFSSVLSQRLEKATRQQYEVTSEVEHLHKMLLENATRQEYNIASALKDLSSVLPKQLENTAIEQFKLALRDSAVRASSEPARPNHLPDTGSPADGLLIREISHALNTPLSHIEAGLLVLQAQLSTPHEADGERERLNALTASVQSCKSIIAGFREAILTTSSKAAWSPPSLREALEALARMHADSLQKEIGVTVEIPDVLDGYSNNYIVSVMSPLIENAAQAALPKSAVLIDGSPESDGTVTLKVTCSPESVPESDEIYQDGFTTKPGHSGTGLSIVQYLLTASPGARLRHFVYEGAITFTITLPSRI